MEWRSLTVRLLEQLPDESKGVQTAKVANKILMWATSTPGTRGKKLGKGDTLRDSLWELVVRKAIDISLDFRRQPSDVVVSVSDDTRPQFTGSESTVRGVASTRRAKPGEAIREDGLMTVCKVPQLYKRRTIAGDDEQSILVDSEQVSIPVYRIIVGDEALRNDLKARGLFGGRK
jgi:hypothetical protein